MTTIPPETRETNAPMRLPEAPTAPRYPSAVRTLLDLAEVCRAHTHEPDRPWLDLAPDGEPTPGQSNYDGLYGPGMGALMVELAHHLRLWAAPLARFDPVQAQIIGAYIEVGMQVEDLTAEMAPVFILAVAALVEAACGQGAVLWAQGAVEFACEDATRLVAALYRIIRTPTPDAARIAVDHARAVARRLADMEQRGVPARPVVDHQPPAADPTEENRG